MPADPSEQYKKWLKKEQQLGDRYVVVDAKWFELWKRFVGIEKSDEEKPTDPGPIDFTKLISSESVDNSNEVQIRSDAVEGNDYSFIPYDLYEDIEKTQKHTGSELVRRVIKHGQFDTIIEVFLVPLQLRESKSSRANIKQMYYSRRTPVEQLKKDICKEFQITPKTNFQLYSSSDVNGNNWEPLEEGVGTVLDDVDLTKNAYIIYDSKPSSSALSSISSYFSSKTYTPGLCGLSNLGNTCFMNSALQCLSNVPQLTQYFLRDEYRQHINRDNPLGMKGDVAQAYGELIHEMWSGKSGSCAPKSLKHSVARYAPQFSGYAQQDSQEFMSFLLDGLHEDLNLVKQKPYVEKKDDDGKTDDSTLATEQWEYYRKRNQSKIHDIFHGQIKSVVQCLTCQTKGRTFDPICFLSLPLPNKKKIRTFKIEYLRLNGQIKTYQIKANEHGRMSNLVQDFCARFQPKQKAAEGTEPMDTEAASASNETFPEDDDEEEETEEDFTKAPDYDQHQPKPDHILMAEVYNHRVYTQYGDSTLLTSILERDRIVFYEVPDSLKKSNSENILMPCVFRSEDMHQNFGYPIYLNVPRQQCTGRHVQEALQKSIGNFLPIPATSSSDKPAYIPSCTFTQNHSTTTKLLSSCLDEHIDFSRKSTTLIVDVAPSVVQKYLEKHDTRGSEKDKYASTSSYDNGVQTRSQQKQRSITLLDCFKYFTTKETLSDEDLWMCPKCKELKKATKKIDIWLLPKVLIIPLKRFNYTRYFRDKIDLLIDCPLRDLDLSQFVLNPAEKDKAKYDLIAVSNHMGGLGGGHYTAHAKNSEDGKWHTFDDSYVSNTDENNVISKAAYVLIYQQRS